MTPAVYRGAVFEQAHPAPGYTAITYTVTRRAERAGWWWCTSSVGGQRRIPERALLNPNVYRSVA